MKKILLLAFACLLLFVGCISVANIDAYSVEGLSEIIEASGTKEELFIKASSWAVEAFISSESVIDYQDKEAGIIKGKFTTKGIVPLTAMQWESVITIEIKDNKARFTIKPNGLPYDPTLSFAQSFNSVNQQTLDRYNATNEMLLESFKKALSSVASDW